MKATPIDPSNGPGWFVTRGTRRYVLWGPRPERDYGLPGTPVISPAREGWAAGWVDDRGVEIFDHWKADTLDEVLALLPGEVEQAFREVAEK